MQDYDDVPNPRPRWVGWVIIIGMILVVMGLINLGLRLTLGTPSDQANAQRVQDLAQQRPELAQGKAWIDGSDCMRCHGVDRKFVGPSLAEVAQRYQGRSDAPEYLAGKIREGSVGVWGRTIMPRHPQVTPEQAVLMAQWILALPAPQP